MRKFTFITLMMILGMSSVSFGKSYLCIDESSSYISLKIDNSFKLYGKYESIEVVPIKYIIKTEDNDNRMVSVKKFGEGSYFCKDGEEGEYQGGITVSIKGGNFLTCRVPFKKEYGGHTYKEFNLDLKFMRFNYYKNIDHTYNVNFEYTTFTNGVVSKKGKCEEI
mgnify:CR=1 FL=1